MLKPRRGLIAPDLLPNSQPMTRSGRVFGRPQQAQQSDPVAVDQGPWLIAAHRVSVVLPRPRIERGVSWRSGNGPHEERERQGGAVTQDPPGNVGGRFP